jgi:hypothetical protein
METFGGTSSPRWLVLLVIVSAMLAVACGAGNSDVVAGAGDLGHIHDLVLDADGRVLVASHTGLYRIDSVDRAVRIGGERHDLMAMTTDEGALIASGHPDLRLEKYRAQDRPPFLGLVRSDNGGESWEVIDLLGDADFHSLTTTEIGLFAAETTGRIWHLDQTGEWIQLGEVGARDLAVDPSDAQHQLAPDYDGTVWVSADGAGTWTPASDAPALVEIEWVDSGMIFGVSEAGTVWLAKAFDGPWTQIATSLAEVETFYIDPTGGWWITVHGGAISHSTDNGTTWNPAYVPPNGP